MNALYYVKIYVKLQVFENVAHPNRVIPVGRYLGASVLHQGAHSKDY